MMDSPKDTLALITRDGFTDAQEEMREIVRYNWRAIEGQQGPGRYASGTLNMALHADHWRTQLHQLVEVR